MTKSDRKKAAALIRTYPAMKNALQNLEEQLQTEGDVLAALRERHHSQKDDQRTRDLMFVYENMMLEKKMLQTRIRAIDRSMEALDEEQRDILWAFFGEKYTRDTPFQLMEQYGYEKSQLYFRRARALERFMQNLGRMNLPSDILDFELPAQGA